jgi:hypothetical protein
MAFLYRVCSNNGQCMRSNQSNKLLLTYAHDVYIFVNYHSIYNRSYPTVFPTVISKFIVKGWVRKGIIIVLNKIVEYRLFAFYKLYMYIVAIFHIKTGCINEFVICKQ